MPPCDLCERACANTRLCASCQQDTADRLERLPALYFQLGIMLTPPQSTGGGRGATLVVSPAPANLHVVDARAEFGILPGWARAMADDRKQPAPVPAGPDLGAQVTAACAALVAARAWIATWPAAGDLAREVRELHDDAVTVVGVDDLPARMGRCPTVVQGALCGAELLLPDGAQVLRCRWCDATYPPGVWAALKVAQARTFNSRITPRV